ncbi:Planctomycete cytochrome C [Adhaeretor mobilis]|uniref:Planctomycete cytochrome C n=2 Tax=Adhaeretor mobilis TaxID=1930276 RepID=A0A517N137_9BACT|nr:Planctomycete cytochrome C [Adhaeretor mobilis]
MRDLPASCAPFVVAILLLVCGTSQAHEQVSFSRDIKPLLAKRCFACHGPDLAESALALHERDQALAITDSGEAAIVLSKPNSSELLRRVSSTAEDLRMPPEGDPLTPREVDLLEQWISQGADYQLHWTFLPPKKSSFPKFQDTGQDSSWVANPLDAFILAKLEAKGLPPSPPAEKAVLARRVYYNLIGLPPTLQQMQTFLDDKRPGGNHIDHNWDAHGDLIYNHSQDVSETDQPIAASLKDLRQRGLLDKTLVVRGGEFGRQPTAEYAEGTGRDHNSYGFTMWMAGGGIKGGTTVGSTDELGSRAVERPTTVKELHATVLQQMGLDPNHLTYFYNGLDQKLVGVEPVEPIWEVVG